MDSLVLLPGARRQLAELRLDERTAFKVALGLLVAGYDRDPPAFGRELEVSEAARPGGRSTASLPGRVRVSYRIFEIRGGGRQLVVERVERDSADGPHDTA